MLLLVSWIECICWYWIAKSCDAKNKWLWILLHSENLSNIFREYSRLEGPFYVEILCVFDPPDLLVRAMCKKNPKCGRHWISQCVPIVATIPTNTTTKKLSLVRCHLSFVTGHVSRVTCHLSLTATCHVSHVTCHISHVTCHCFFGRGTQRWNWFF